MRRKLGSILLYFSLLALLPACGGGGGGNIVSAPTKVIVKLATNGTLTTGVSGIGAIDSTINYQQNKGLSITSSDIVTSGLASNSFVETNVSTQGEVIFGNMTGGSFNIGEFATLTFSIASGFTPSASDFSIAAGSTSVYGSDNNVTSQPGISVIIQSVTFQ